MVSTHCLPNGSLGTDELPVIPINDSVITVVEHDLPTAARGVVLFLHGLNQGRYPLPWPLPVDVTGGLFQGYWTSLADTLNENSWSVLVVPMNGDNWSGPYASVGVANDINYDTGTRYVTNVLHWWDHMVDYVHNHYGWDIPIVIVGGSWGGSHALWVAAHSTRPPLAIVPICPATIVSNIGSGVWHGPTISNSAGCDIGTHALDSYTGPSLVMYGTSDFVAGWGLNGQGTCTTSPVQSNLDLAIVNAQAAGRPCTRAASHFTLHGFDSVDLDTISGSPSGWFQTAVHPLAPIP